MSQQQLIVVSHPQRSVGGRAPVTAYELRLSEMATLPRAGAQHGRRLLILMTALDQDVEIVIRRKPRSQKTGRISVVAA